MADPIETWRIVQFRNTVEHLLQQMGGKLRSTVSFQSGYVGKSASPVNQVGETEAQESNGRKGDSPDMEVPLARRWLHPRTWEWGKLVETLDQLYTGISPAGPFTQAGVKAMARAEDRVILEAFFGKAKAGEQAEKTITFPAGNEVDVNEGAPNSGMNHAKLLKAREVLASKHVDLDAEELYMVLTERDVTDLFGINTTLSIDFVEGKPVSSGKLPPLYGINFVGISRATLQKYGLSDGTVDDLPVWCKSGMHLGVWQERTLEVGPDAAKKFRPRIFMEQTHNACRLQEGKVVRVKSQH